MNLKQLEHLLMVAEAGSFSRAAERLHITQPALSRSIRLLEDTLDARLIDRMGRRNELTPLGETVAARARQLIFGAEELRRSVELTKRGSSGQIRIGMGAGPASMLMTPFMVHVARHHPDVRLTVSRGPLELQLRQLRERSVDALVIDRRAIPPAEDLVVDVVAELRGGFMCRSGHPLLARGGPVTFDDVVLYPLASTALTDEIANLLVRHFGPRANPALSVRLRSEDITSLVNVMRQTDTILFAIYAAAREHMATGEVVELITEPPYSSNAIYAVVTLAGRTESPSMKLFRRFVAQHLPE